jgi:MscS family membrane protein
MGSILLIWYNWIFDHFWMAQIAMALIAIAMADFVLKKVLFFAKSHKAFNRYVVLSPIRAILWLIFASFLVELIDRQWALGGKFLFVSHVRNAGIIFLLACILLRLRKAVLDHGFKSSFDPVFVEVISKLFAVVVICFSALFIMQSLGVDIIPLITFGGIGVAAVGFASKDVISNLFGGAMLYATRPFIAGDLIEIPEKKILGYVKEVGWYHTSMQDLQKKVIYIPNAVFSTQSLINLSRRTHRRIEEVIPIGFSHVQKTPAIIGSIRSFLRGHRDIDSSQPLYVFLKNFGPYSADIEILVYTQSTQYERFKETKQEILLEIHRMISEASLEMPYPTMSVDLVQKSLPPT